MKTNASNAKNTLVCNNNNYVLFRTDFRYTKNRYKEIIAKTYKIGLKDFKIFLRLIVAAQKRNYD